MYLSPTVALAAVGSKVVVLLLLIYCLMYFPWIVGVLWLFLFCYALLCVHSRFAIILTRKRKLVALLLLSHRCIVTINVLWLFLTVPWLGLQCVIVVFPDPIHLLFDREQVCGCLASLTKELAPLVYFDIKFIGINMNSYNRPVSDSLSKKYNLNVTFRFH